jgi:hypothetical protein
MTGGDEMRGDIALKGLSFALAFSLLAGGASAQSGMQDGDEGQSGEGQQMMQGQGMQGQGMRGQGQGMQGQGMMRGQGQGMKGQGMKGQGMKGQGMKGGRHHGDMHHDGMHHGRMMQGGMMQGGASTLSLTLSGKGRQMQFRCDAEMSACLSALERVREVMAMDGPRHGEDE